MTTEFEPKITYRIAAIMMASGRKTTPWEYLDNWAMSDKGPDETLQKLNERMQNRWPGNYTIVQKEVRDPQRFYKVLKYDFQFNPPEAETMFRIKYS